MKPVKVSVGDQVYAKEGGEEFGAVRHVHEKELIIIIEGFGEVTVAASAVTAVHDGKIVLDVKKLPDDVRRAIGHAHDLETE